VRNNGGARAVQPARPSPPEAVAAAARYGVDLPAHRSELLSVDSARAADLIVVMDPGQRRRVCDRVGRSEHDVLVLGDLDPEPVASRLAWCRQERPMILGVGFDVVETERIAQALARHGRRFETRVYTPAELAESAARVDRAQALAGRFAAKEALLKALGTGSARGISFPQVEVLRRDGGQAAMMLTGSAAAEARRLGVRHIHLSLSHQPGLAAAVVILEG